MDPEALQLKKKNATFPILPLLKQKQTLCHLSSVPSVPSVPEIGAVRRSSRKTKAANIQATLKSGPGPAISSVLDLAHYPAGFVRLLAQLEPARRLRFTLRSIVDTLLIDAPSAACRMLAVCLDLVDCHYLDLKADSFEAQSCCKLGWFLCCPVVLFGRPGS